MAPPLFKDLVTLQNEGIEVYDAYLCKKVLLFAQVLCCICDNVRASELLGLLGGRAKYFCRFCMVGLHALLSISLLCLLVSFIQADREGDPTHIGQMRTNSTTLDSIAAISQATSKATKKHLSTLTGVKGLHSPLLSLQLDVHRYVCYHCMLHNDLEYLPALRAMPVEILHTILLGPYKYLLKVFISSLSNTQKAEILARMNSFNMSGFHVAVHGNICYHHNSFVGRDYKSWAQMCLFIATPYLTDSEKHVWLCLTKVGNIVVNT